jgi:hypothetical protein
MLFEGSGISYDVAAERGYYTARQRSEVPDAFKDYQKRPGLVIPVLTPSGERRVRLRPDRPRKGKDGRIRKYEQAGGVGCVLDVHPRNLKRLQDPTVPLWAVEGEKKGDALTTRGECAIAVPGVWNWQRSGEMLPDWDRVALEGRLVYVCFDSDAWSNSNVQLALECLVAALEDRGAEVLAVHLDDKPDGSKAGADDFLVAGGSVAELKLRARKFVPEDIDRIRLSKDEKLRAAVEDLERRYYEFAREHGRKSTGGETAQDVYLKLIEAARRHGKVHRDGIRVQKAHGPLALEAKVSSRTLVKCILRLEKWGVLYRDNEGRKSKQAGHFVLCAGVKHNGGTPTAEGTVSERRDPCTLHPRAPRLMWSRAKWKPTKKMVRDHRLGKLSRLPEPLEGVRRMGKRRGHLFDALDAADGKLTLDELGAITGHPNPRELVRRKRTEKGRDGLLVWPEEAGIVRIEEGTVSLTPDWLDRLEAQRELGEEIEMAEIAEQRYKQKRADFHEHGPVEAMSIEDPPPLMGPARVEEVVHERAKEDLAVRVEDQRRKVGTTVETFVFDKLKALGQIRLALLMEIYEDAGGEPWEIPPALRRMGCQVERLPEFENRQFVFPPAKGAA